MTINGDLIHEADELVVVLLENPTGATIGGYFGLGFAFITNDDPLPVVLPGLISTIEGDSGTHTVALPVRLNRASSSTVTVQYVTYEDPSVPNGATAPSDYTTASGTVTFSPGQTAKTVPITIRGDTATEARELVLVLFHTPNGATIGGFLGLGFIFVNDDD